MDLVAWLYWPEEYKDGVELSWIVILKLSIMF